MILINAVSCNKAVFGTGLVPCELRLKDFKSFIIVPKSWSLNLATDTFDGDYVISQIQNGTFVPFLNTVEFLNNTPDPTTKEYQGGITAVIRNGKPQYSFEYDNGIGFHKAAYGYNSFQSYNVVLVDSAGTVAVAESADGLSVTGFALSMLNTRTYVPQVGDETAKTLIEFQIANEEQFNKRMALIPVDQSGVDINSEVMGVVGVNITGASSVANGTQMIVTAGNNSIFGIQALAASNVRARNTVTNTVMPITSIAEGTIPGNYAVTFTTPPIAGVKFVFETYDATATPPTATALVGNNQLYRGVSKEITVVA